MRGLLWAEGYCPPEWFTACAPNKEHRWPKQSLKKNIDVIEMSTLHTLAVYT